MDRLAGAYQADLILPDRKSADSGSSRTRMAVIAKTDGAAG
jgi:hypothetical protein